MTDLGEEFESALRRAKDARPGLGFGLGLAGAKVPSSEKVRLLLSSGLTLGRDMMIYLFTNLSTTVTSSRPAGSPLALTSLPSYDSSRLVNDALVSNTSVDNYSVNNQSINNYLADNYSVNNASAYNKDVPIRAVDILAANPIERPLWNSLLVGSVKEAIPTDVPVTKLETLPTARLDIHRSRHPYTHLSIAVRTS